MPINYSRRLAGNSRTANANTQLGLILAFIAGAINAGGFLAVHQYTSHMTGVVSSMADTIALGAYELALTGAGALFSFLLGAASSAVMVNFARRHHLHSEYAFPLLVEALLMLVFGLLGARITEIDGVVVSFTVMLLSFIMGLQNAIVTKLSNAVIRTTHVTGMVTDIGIELGKLFYWNYANPAGTRKVMADRSKLKLLSTLVCLFFAGGVIGALGFKFVGYISTVPLAICLMVFVAVPISDDLKDFIGNRKP